MRHAQSPSTIIKPLLILTIISAVVCLGLFIMVLTKNYSGIGSTYTSTLVCNTYLAIKYETEKHIGYRTRFITLGVSFICLILDSVFNIRSFMAFRDLQEANRGQDLRWKPCELYCKYICLSLAIIFILPMFIFYMSITIQQGKCLNQINLYWILFIIGSSIVLAISVICWVITFKFILTVPSQQNEQKYLRYNKQQRSIGHKQIREKQAQMRNIFQVQQQQMYKTNRSYSNRDAIEPLIVQNSPIPLLHPQITITPKNDPKGTLDIYNNSNMSSPTQFIRKAASGQPDKSKNPMKKSQVTLMIEKKKEKFRQLNPYKGVNKTYSPSKMQQNAQMEYIPDEIDEKDKMKNLPKTYPDYIRQSKRPKRMPDIPKLQDAIQKQIAKSLLKDESAQKPFIKKYRKTKQSENKVQDGQIQFIEQKEGEVIEPNRGEAELFYHKPIIQNKIIKKRKVLFEDDVIVEPAQFFNQLKQKEVIINKLKDGKSNHKSKSNLKPQELEDGANEVKKKIMKTLTQEDIMLTFLKSKFNVQNEQI